MPKHETKNCIRCSADFECKVGNVTQCHCYEVNATQDERDRIASEFDNCLCNKCLKEVISQYRKG